MSEIFYQPDGPLDYERLDVYLEPNTSDDELFLLWCDVLVRGGANRGNTDVFTSDGLDAYLPYCGEYERATSSPA